LRCIARWGLTKTTVDDIAREAGVGRATLYRMFPGGRDAVLEAVVATETTRFVAHLRAELATARSLEDVLTTTVAAGGRALAGHAALQFLIAHEPEAILPHISFQRMDALLRAVGTQIGPVLLSWLDTDAEAAARGAEWIARIVLAYLFAPSPDVDFADLDSVRHLVRTFVLPGFQPVTTN
ncbi:MAG: TetR/AcrR family transcriptional regulator, partial [Acidimicrobiales bacterium]